jgi:hypothetical protein
MNQRTELIFSPWTGARLEPPQDLRAEAYRTQGAFQWVYNPWNGKRRSTGDVESDPYGRGIWVADWGPMPAAMEPSPAVAAVLEQQFGAKSAPVKDTNPKSAAGDAKVPLFLCSPIAMAEWSLAQFAGTEKYGLVNWREAGVRASTYVSALLRHVEAFNAGEDRDPDDDTDHLGNVMACCAILLEARALGLLTDDRPRAIEFRQSWLGVQQRMKDIREKYADRNPTHYTIDRDRANSR